MLLWETLFKWMAECQASFDELKQKLVEASILAHPDFTKPFKLHTDASGFALGAILAQVDDQNCEHVIGYAVDQ